MPPKFSIYKYPWDDPSYQHKPYNHKTIPEYQSKVDFIFGLFMFIFLLISLILRICRKIAIRKYHKRCKKLEEEINTIGTETYSNYFDSNTYFLINNLYINNQIAVCIFPLGETHSVTTSELEKLLLNEPKDYIIENHNFFSKLYYKTMLEYSKSENRLIFYIDEYRDNSLEYRDQSDKKEHIVQVIDDNTLNNDTYLFDNNDIISSDSSSTENLIHQYPLSQASTLLTIFTKTTLSNPKMKENNKNFHNLIKPNLLDFLIHPEHSPIHTIATIKSIIEKQNEKEQRFLAVACKDDWIEIVVYQRVCGSQEIDLNNNSNMNNTDSIINNNSNINNTDSSINNNSNMNNTGNNSNRNNPNNIDFTMSKIETHFLLSNQPLKTFIFVIENTCEIINREQMKQFKFQMV